MRIPRDISGAELAKKLERFGYHITIPNHRELRVGTLNSILTDIADHLHMEREKLIEDLF